MGDMSVLGRTRPMPSMFVQRGDAVEYVTSGSAYRKVRTDKLVETAEVRAVYIDGAGIPHIRYDVAIAKPNWPMYKDGPRVLSARSFFESFPERVQR